MAARRLESTWEADHTTGRLPENQPPRSDVTAQTQDNLDSDRSLCRPRPRCPFGTAARAWRWVELSPARRAATHDRTTAVPRITRSARQREDPQRSPGITRAQAPGARGAPELRATTPDLQIPQRTGHRTTSRLWSFSRSSPGRGPEPLPLLLTQGWPGSFCEYLEVLGLLSGPPSTAGIRRTRSLSSSVAARVRVLGGCACRRPHIRRGRRAVASADGRWSESPALCGAWQRSRGGGHRAPGPGAP
jgi:hypothetical protein